MRAVQSSEPQGQRYSSEEIEVLRSVFEPLDRKVTILPSGGDPWLGLGDIDEKAYLIDLG